MINRSAQPAEIGIAVTIPAGHHLYADTWSVMLGSAPADPLAAIPLKRVYDPLIEGDREVFERSFTARYACTGETGKLTVVFQGCSESICFTPETHVFTWAGDQVERVASGTPESAPAPSSEWLSGMRVVATASGFMKPEAFLSFLNPQPIASGATQPERRGFTSFTRDPSRFLAEKGWWLTVLLILLGGLLLNLTPCVLPMIPINLAIIGAGAQNGSRSRGFLLGGVYGAGMALAYGVLGLSVVVTGGFFGAIQSNPIFNLTIAIVFVALSLSLFDVFPIDFSRFQRSGGTSRTGIGVVLSMGAMAALLAGACVAPVVIAVLLLAGRLYGEGLGGALLLPFLLGVGMALPWPFAGAGLAFLPKPGRWMAGVKMVFGVGVLLMALYYAHLAWQGIRPVAAAHGGLVAGDRAAWEQRLEAARAEGKPVVLDFWATWCKNCHAMSRTTLRDPAVLEALKAFVFIPVQAERPADEPARGHLQALDVSGLPTYIILKPADPVSR